MENVDQIIQLYDQDISQKEFKTYLVTIYFFLHILRVAKI